MKGHILSNSIYSLKRRTCK